MMGDRGQAYTLEGVIGAILITSAVIFGLQAVNVAPWTQGTNDQKVESLRTEAQDLLTVAAEEGTLAEVVTCYEGGNPAPALAERTPDNATEFGAMLNQTFYQNGFRYNVYLHYENETAETTTSIYPGTERQPGDGAVRVTRQLTVLNSTAVSTGGSCDIRAGTVESNWADIDVPKLTGSNVAYVVEVRLVVW